MATIELSADVQGFEATLAELGALLPGFVEAVDCPAEVRDAVFGLPDIVAKLFKIQGNRLAADGTVERGIFIEPSGRLLELLAAVRARDFGAEVFKHLSAPDGGLPSAILEPAGSGVMPGPAATIPWPRP